MRWRIVLVVVAACGHATPEAPAPAAAPASTAARDACTVDDDCVVSNFAGCCACPACAIAAPHARSRKAERIAEDVCAVASCNAGECAAAGTCPPGEPAAHFVARCQGGVCAMDRR